LLILSAAVDFPGQNKAHLCIYEFIQIRARAEEPPAEVEVFVVALAALNYFTFRAAPKLLGIPAKTQNRSRCVSHVSSRNNQEPGAGEPGPNRVCM